MFDFGLRSLGEPAIVHLQTVIKNWIGNTTGILCAEDKHIQDELADKVNVLNRKLSIEAQTSRSLSGNPGGITDPLLEPEQSLANSSTPNIPGSSINGHWRPTPSAIFMLSTPKITW